MIEEIRLAMTPMPRTIAKPLTCAGPTNPRITHVISVDVFESRMAGHARLTAASTAAGMVRPARTSSLKRSKIRTLASTAMPTDRMKPVMPASVSVTGKALNTAKTAPA